MKHKNVELIIYLLIITAITLFFNIHKPVYHIPVLLVSVKIYCIYNSIITNFRDRECLYKDRIKKLRSYIKELETPILDPATLGLTETEMDLLEVLCLYRESNVELAYRLSKSPNTVKVQLNSIMNKAGANSRHQLIELCGNYFR